MEAKTFVMPLAVIGTIALVYALLKRSTPATIVLAQADGNTNPASVGGDPLPTQSQITIQATSPVTPGTVQQLPSAFASGVPAWSGQTQFANDINDNFRVSTATLSPSDASARPVSYAPIQRTQSNIVPQPASQPRATGTGYIRNSPPDLSTDQNTPCGCGQNKCSSCVPRCSTSASRYSDGRGGCLAMDRRRQIQAATRINPNIWNNLQYQLQSSGNYDFFQGFQEEIFFMRKTRPQTEGFTEPAAPALGYVGNTMY